MRLSHHLQPREGYSRCNALHALFVACKCGGGLKGRSSTHTRQDALWECKWPILTCWSCVLLSALPAKLSNTSRTSSAETVPDPSTSTILKMTAEAHTVVGDRCVWAANKTSRGNTLAGPAPAMDPEAVLTLHLILLRVQAAQEVESVSELVQGEAAIPIGVKQVQGSCRKETLQLVLVLKGAN